MLPLDGGHFITADKGKRKGKQKSAFEIQNILNLKSGENKKKPLDSEESRVNLMAEDEGFDNIFACFCRQKSKKQPVFELVAADVHRTSAFKLVRIPH